MTVTPDSWPAHWPAAQCDVLIDGKPFDARDPALNLPTDMISTPVDSLPALVAEVRANWMRTAGASGTGVSDGPGARSLAFRKQQLRQLALLTKDHELRIAGALARDLHKNLHQARITEINILHTEIADAMSNLDSWAGDTKVGGLGLQFMSDAAAIRHDPLGLVLIIGAWNYPFLLALAPLVAAIAAGNAAIIKPSEMSPTVAQLLAELVPQYLDQRYYRVVNGAVPETTALLKEQFDHIFYTGNGAVGQIVMTAAAKHLTPVTLELGGKSPTIVHDSVDINETAKLIAFGKYLNAGQTCVAPDYVLCPRKLQEPLVAAIQEAVAKFYGADPKQSPDFGRIVTDRHFERLSALLRPFDAPDHDAKVHGHVVIGGLKAADRATRYIPPTVVADVTLDSVLMRDELFGPILPIVPIDDEAPEWARACFSDGARADSTMVQAAAILRTKLRESPLALYVFSRNTSAAQWLLDHTRSGGACVNDVMMHMVPGGLPFGGVGGSGMGAYHGKFGFDRLSHQRAVLARSARLAFLQQVRNPPWHDRILKILGWMAFKRVV
ncbi:Aldehyde dehydrogenase [Allomyces javanicus]|nr:Aldehyde dehydrogenase [Allomyces javanicus]